MIPSGGSLTVIGTGIRPQHLTPESHQALLEADDLLYLAAEPEGGSWLEQLHPNARSLEDCYVEGEERRTAYEAMVEAILEPVRQGRRVCAAFYGHPGVFVTPSHEAVRRARAEGFPARMLPAVSAEDCLYADLGIDPGRSGRQSYEATDFLERPRPIDGRAYLILWQISVVGERRTVTRPRSEGLSELAAALLAHYPPEHEVVLYEASPYPIAEAIVERLPLAALADEQVAPMATLVIPPRER
ncbi:MAG: SAM-dependent methyltransferase [Gaiellaceae bacterium]